MKNADSNRFTLINKYGVLRLGALIFAGLIITASTTLYMRYIVNRIAEQDFINKCQDMQKEIVERLNDHARILHSGVAFFKAANMVSREEWHIFTGAHNIEKQLPGIQGIGFSILVPRENLSRHTREIRSQGFPEYRLWPDGDREVYTSIIYLEPFSRRNLKAFGYDMFSEPVRREAMERARDTDSASLSGKVVLVQETEREVQAGTLMYYPVYRKGMPVKTVEQRRAAIKGWVYSPYRMNDLMQGILGSRILDNEKQVHLQIFDGVQPLPRGLLYDSNHGNDNNHRSGERFTRQLTVEFNGSFWTLCVAQSGGGPISLDYISVWLTMTVGILITLMLFMLTRSLMNTRVAKLRAEDMAAELKKSKETAEKYLNVSAEIIISIDNDGNITLMNDNGHELLDWEAGKLIGKNWFDTCLPKENLQEVKNVFSMIMEGNLNSVISYENNVITKNGEIKTVLWHNTVLFDDSGAINGLLSSGEDITDRKQSEEKIKSLLAEKELILKEVHHRLKNNMNTINNILYLQADTLEDPKAIAALEDTANRVKSMGLLYDKLYHSPEYQNISVMDYLTSLVDEIIANFPNNKGVKIEKNIDDFILDAKRMQPIGIIINELLSNIMKYAFTGRSDALIKVMANIISADPESIPTVSIIIKDNGNGMPESVDFENSTGFGLQLVWMLTKDLNGTIRIERGSGTEIILEFTL